LLAKIALPLAFGALICGAAVALHVYEAKTRDRKLAGAARIKAEEGDAKAQCDIGRMYYHGQGVQQNYAEALRWYRKAADQGDTKAQYGVGYMYYYGQAVQQDYAEAFLWYNKAAEQGYAKAQVNLSLMYYYGQGTPRDYATAVGWYRKAANQGDAVGQEGLGFMYYYGQGTPQDFTEAFRWFSKAAYQGDAKAQDQMGYMYSHGLGAPQSRADANHWYRKAADQDDPYALRVLSEGLTPFTDFTLLVQLLGGIVLSFNFFQTNFLSRGKKPREFRLRVISGTGILCLFSVSLNWYGYTHSKIRCLACGLNAFTLFKWMFDFVLVALLIYIVRAKPGVPKDVI
jgi:TPR repeat protein